MPDVRLNTTSTPTARPKAKAAPQPTAEPQAKPAAAGDRLQTQSAPTGEGVRIVQEALKFPPKPPKGEDMTPWLMDAYSRLLTAETTMDTLQKSRSQDGVDFKTYADLRSKVWEAQGSIAKLDKDGAVKAEFFQTVLPEARKLIDALETYPAPPADREGKIAWLADAKQELAKAKAADELMNTAWFDFKALDFDKRTDASSKLFDFGGRVRHVEYELNPPAPRASTSGAKSSGASGPIFSNTQGAAELANSKNPIGQTAGAVALPFAVTIDVIDLITRPLRWLDNASQKK